MSQQTGHRVVLEFEDGSTYAKLVCPDTGCQPAVTCGECHRHVDDTEREPCEYCKDGLGEDCVLASWFGVLGSEYLAGTVELDVGHVEWDFNEGPKVHLSLSAEVSAR